nr:NTP transferase domain-containing protein [Kordiimonas gwangyangensis]
MHDGLTLTESQLAIGAGATVANARVSTGFLPALSSAIVLAGERPERDMLGAQGGIHGKAMAPIAGKPMIAHVVATLARSGLVGEILISSNSDLTGEAELTHAAAGIPLRHVPTRTTICSSVKAAYDCVPKGRGALVTTADNPLLSVEALSDFIMAAAGHDGLSLGLVPDHVIRAKYPTSKRTYYRFRDAAVSGANLFYFRGDAATNVLGFWERAESHRKKPWKILSAFGWGTVMGMALRRLSLKDGFARAGKVVGCPVNAHLLKEAEAAMDVDSPRDFVAAERILVDRMKHTRGPQKWGGSGTQSFAVFDLDRTLTKRGTFTPFLLSTRKGMVARSVLMLRLLRHMILYKAKRISRLELKNRMLTLAFKASASRRLRPHPQGSHKRRLQKACAPGRSLRSPCTGWKGTPWCSPPPRLTFMCTPSPTRWALSVWFAPAPPSPVMSAHPSRSAVPIVTVMTNSCNCGTRFWAPQASPATASLYLSTATIIPTCRSLNGQMYPWSYAPGSRPIRWPWCGK